MAGAIEFFTRRRLARDPDLATTLESVGSQIGLFLERAGQRAQLAYDAALLANLDDAVIASDADFRITSWNRAAERIYAWSEREALGHKAFEFLQSQFLDCDRGEAFRRLVEYGSFRGELLQSTKDGSHVAIEAVAIAMRDDERRVTGYVSVNRDITERRRVEQELRRARDAAESARREVESFSYSVSHDLRAPLRAMDGFSQALLEDYGDRLDDVGRDYLSRVRAAAQRMSLLIDDMLRLARLSKLELKEESLDLSATALEVAGELRRTDPARDVAFRIEDGLRALGDPHLVRVLLENLIGNAWKFTAKRPRAEIEVGYHGKNGGTGFFVRDNGAGFDMAYSAKLFGPFQRLHPASDYPGTGIGLAIAQRIVSRHGGRVWAEGAVGRGATFYFTLPQAPVPQAALA